MAFYFTMRIEVATRGDKAKPTADEIWDAFNHVPLADGAQWVGPLAKIVREWYVFHPNKTKISRILAVEGPYTDEGALHVAQQTAQAVATALRAIRIYDDVENVPIESRWSDVSVTPYYEPNDGPLPAWQQGFAAIPQNVEDLPNGTGEIIESGLHRLGGLIPGNPLTDASKSLQNLFQGTAKWLLIGGVAIGGVVLLTYLLPARTITRTVLQRRSS